MNTRERLGYSLIAALTADVLVAAACEWLSPPAAGPHHPWAFLAFAVIMLVGVIPGWLVFAVLVVIIGDPESLLGVIFLLLGCYVGPFILSIRQPWEFPPNPWASIHSPDPILRLASSISVLTTLLYLGLVKLMMRRRITSK